MSARPTSSISTFAALALVVSVLGGCTALTIRSTAECKCAEEATAKCTTTGNEAAVGHSSPQRGNK